MINRFNNQFMLVNENGKALIYQPGFDPVLKRRRFDRLSTRDLQTLYLNRRVQVGADDKNRPIYKTEADIWLRHPDRRQFIGGVTFDPSMQAPAGVLNLWQGFAVKPAPGDWSLMRNHINIIICEATARPPAGSPRSCGAGALGPVGDQVAQFGAGGGGGVAGNPGSLLPASGIWQPRIRAILVVYPKFGQA